MRARDVVIAIRRELDSDSNTVCLAGCSMKWRSARKSLRALPGRDRGRRFPLPDALEHVRRLRCHQPERHGVAHRLSRGDDGRTQQDSREVRRGLRWHRSALRRRHQPLRRDVLQGRCGDLRLHHEGSPFFGTKAGQRLLRFVREKMAFEGRTESDFEAQKKNRWRLQGKTFFDIFAEVIHEDLYASSYGMMSESVHGS